MTNSKTYGTAVEFYRYLEPGNILCQSRAATGAELIAELTARLAQNNPELSVDRVVADVMAREEICPTVIAPGLAMPHARLGGLDRLLVALATCVPGVDFKAPEMPPVQVAVLVLSPESDPGVHLQVMSALAREFRIPGRVKMLVGLTRPREVLEFFHSSRLVLPEYLLVRDLMSLQVETLRAMDTLHEAIRKFAETRVFEMAVLDSNDKLCGLVCLADILEFSLPGHTVWMDDLAPIYNFQPFADMLKKANETRVAEIMRESFIRIGADVPAVELAKMFLSRKVNEVMVVDDKGRLVGAVELRDFCAKLFWE